MKEKVLIITTLIAMTIGCVTQKPLCGNTQFLNAQNRCENWADYY